MSKNDARKFVGQVNTKISWYTAGVGGGYRLSEAGASHVAQRFARGETDAHVVADDLLRRTDAFSLLLQPDWM